jgi:hypothetical protein
LRSFYDRKSTAKDLIVSIVAASAITNDHGGEYTNDEQVASAFGGLS